MKNLKTFYEKTILENIDLNGYELQSPQKHLKIESLTEYDKIQSIYPIFKSEYVHENNKHLNPKEVFSQWLQGLPNCLSVPYMNYEILENAKRWGYNLNTKEKENDFLDNYFMNLSNSFFRLLHNL
jgi:hypothetical protein